MAEATDKITVPAHEFASLLSEVVEEARFDVLGQGTVSGAELSEMHQQGIILYGGLAASYADPQVRQDLMEKLTQHLHSILYQYIGKNAIGEDIIGNGFTYFTGGIILITVTNLAKEIVRAAAILGPEHATKTLYEWARGDPVPYRTCVVLSGISVDQALQMARGIHFVDLPVSSDKIASYLPENKMFDVDIISLLGAVKMTIDCKAKPAFYRFTGYDPTIVERTWTYGSFLNGSLDSLCGALSLACNSYVSWIRSWVECDAEKVFGRLVGGRGSRPLTDNIVFYSKVTASQQQLDEAHSIMSRWTAENTGEGLDLAIRRWVRSKQHASRADQFIELRIALEALYLKGLNSELAFRLATRGAWHLGANLEDRRECYDTLRRFYRYASTVVHAGEVTSDEGKFAAAQEICRKAILKRLDEHEEPDWDEMILGGSPKVCSD